MAYQPDWATNKLNDLVGSQEMFFDLACFEELSPPEQALLGTWELAAEVHNGGVLQYVHNSSRDHARPMVEILRSLDATRAATLLESAIALAGPGTRWADEPTYIRDVLAIPADIRSRLWEMDRKLLDVLDEVYVLVFRYLSKHRDEFDVPADFWAEAAIP